MTYVRFLLLSVLAILFASSQANALAPQSKASGAAEASVSPQRALVTQYCVSCHNKRTNAGGLALDGVSVENVREHADTWEKVIRKLRGGLMPPAGRPRPDQQTYNGFREWLETELDRAAVAKPQPGSVLIHRLNRTEYTNAVRDLLAVEIDGEQLLPADHSDLGFDNIAGSLSLSPVLLERYLLAARKSTRLAVGDVSITPVFETYAIPKMSFQDDRMSEDLPFGSRGGIAVRHYFPLDGDYVIKVRLKRAYVDHIRGLSEPHQLDIRLDGERIERFTVGGQSKGRPAPASYAGNIPGDAEWEQYAQSADSGLEVRLSVKAGLHVVGVSFLRRPGELEGVLQPPLIGFSFAIDEARSSPSGRFEPAVDTVTIGGPYEAKGRGETPSFRKIFVCYPKRPADEAPCAKKILSAFARRAYRRAVTSKDNEVLLDFYNSGRSEGGFERGIELGLVRVLIDPDFLFRVERDPAGVRPGSIYRLSDLELASRLSFFLWSSIPDDELLGVAIGGKLKSPGMLERQVRRMLADSRSTALIDNFVGQWLQLRNIRGVKPDPDLFFPLFDENLREAFQRETELFVGTQFREDRSVVDLLTANYTFLNERLARHYDIPNVYGSHYRRVTFNNDEARGGLLAQGSLLTVTSYPNRTSPVLRGKWLLEQILGTPPPPPPPNVPGLPDRGEGGKPTSVRERLEQHRKNPVCASCHAPMDPLGFALENFDAIGAWRTSEAGRPIDTSSVLPGGTKIEGLTGLRTFLLGRREQFVSNVIEKLLTYALGRGLEYYDMPAVREIARQVAPHDSRWSSILLAIVQSTPFQMRKAATP